MQLFGCANVFAFFCWLNNGKLSGNYGMEITYDLNKGIRLKAWASMIAAIAV